VKTQADAAGELFANVSRIVVYVPGGPGEISAPDVGPFLEEKARKNSFDRTPRRPV